MKKFLVLLTLYFLSFNVFSQATHIIEGCITINVKQKDASIFIDGNYVGKGSAEVSLQIEKEHTYVVKCDLYHEETGKVTVTAGELVEKNINLLPAYGYININTSPVEGAIVYIDGVEVGITPYNSNKLSSGTHKVKVVKEMYNSVEQNFSITDGNTVQATLNMTANHEILTINSDYDADIYIDEEFKAKGTWSGYVPLGIHVIEVRKDKYRSKFENINVVLGKYETVNIKNFEPICGVLELRSTPTNADVYIDGNLLGQTPLIISDIIIGKHQLLIQKEGCSSQFEYIIIKENELLCINETLQIGKDVLIKTDKFGDKIYVDGDYIGRTPFTANLPFGKHEVKVKRRLYTAVKNIEVNADYAGQDNSVKQACVLSYEPLNKYLNKGIIFLTLNVSYSIAPQMSYGVTYGQVRKMGWFVSIMSNFNFRFNANTWNDIYSLNKAVFSEESSKTRFSFMSGLVFKTIGPIYVKIGAGYGARIKCWKISDKWYEYVLDTYKGIDLTTGLMLSLNGCVISGDVVTTNFKTIEVKLGVGINWQQ